VLSELKVKGFGIIEEITWQPAAGFNVITGETGAGKSLVVDAVEALLSGVPEENIRHGSEAARIEGIFLLPRAPERLYALLAEKGLETDEGCLIVTGDYRRQGRATARVNRQAVSRPLLRDIGASLVDIHGQSGHLSLLDGNQHLEFLDDYAHSRGLRRDFGVRAAALRQAERELQAWLAGEQELSRRTELLNFQIDEIKRAALRAGEEETLSRELARIASAEKLKAAAYEIYQTIYGDEGVASSAVDRLNEALPVLKRVEAADPWLQARHGYLEGVVHGLEELARELRAYGDALEYDPQRLEEVQARLELIRGLERKYGGSIGEVLAYLAGAEGELAGLTSSGERRAKLEAEIERLKGEMGALAFRLSGERRKAARGLVAAVQKELGDLNMSQVAFDVSLTQEPWPDGIPLPDGRYKFSSSGVDAVAFMAATNPGEPLKPLARIASAGELSRFMLALKVALAEADTIPVLIFDEIDVGIGGRSGEVIGRKLWRLARNHQVICVTHLPQIAAFADAHYRVSKQSTGERTVSTIIALQGKSRFHELAIMLGGPRYTSSSLQAARELVKKAETWKNAEG
jgi:DNA repair protein RecN (Recombination protein N)